MGHAYGDGHESEVSVVGLLLYLRLGQGECPMMNFTEEFLHQL